MSDVIVGKPKEKIHRQDKPWTIKPSEFKPSEYAYADFSATIPSDCPFEEVLKSGFWSNVLHLVRSNTTTNEPDKTGATIQIRTQDHSYYALLYIRATMANGVIVKCIGPTINFETGELCPVDLQTGLPWEGRPEVRTDAFDIRWNVGKKGFDVVRRADQQVVADGKNLPVREMAEEWIEKATKAA